MKKKIFRGLFGILSASIIILTLTAVVYGENEQSDVPKEVIPEMENFTSEIPFMGGSGSGDMERAYKLYDFIHPDIVELYKEKGSIEEMISDVYVWMVPTKNNFLAIVKYKDDKWQTVGADDYSTWEGDDVDYVIINKKLVDQIISDELGDAKIESVKYLSTTLFHLEFVFVKADGIEYLMPYNVWDGGFVSLERRLYRSDEFSLVMDTLYDDFNMASRVFDEDGNVVGYRGFNGDFPVNVELESAVAEAAKIIPAADESVTLFQKISIMVMGAALVGVVILFAVKYKGGEKS